MGAVLLVKGAGSGKSAIMQTIGVIRGGMTIIVENTQALGSDQRSKIDAASQECGLIVGFQLDSLSQAESEQLAEYLLSLGNDTDASIFLFSSPEVLTKKFWGDMVKSLIEKNLVTLVCVDEVHLFVDFGSSF